LERESLKSRPLNYVNKDMIISRGAKYWASEPAAEPAASALEQLPAQDAPANGVPAEELPNQPPKVDSAEIEATPAADTPPDSLPPIESARDESNALQPHSAAETLPDIVSAPGGDSFPASELLPSIDTMPPVESVPASRSRLGQLPRKLEGLSAIEPFSRAESAMPVESAAKILRPIGRTPYGAIVLPQLENLPTVDQMPEIERVSPGEIVPPIISPPPIETLAPIESLPEIESLPTIERVPARR
jgi:hypothetical protein